MSRFPKNMVRGPAGRRRCQWRTVTGPVTVPVPFRVADQQRPGTSELQERADSLQLYLCHDVAWGIVFLKKLFFT